MFSYRNLRKNTFAGKGGSTVGPICLSGFKTLLMATYEPNLVHTGVGRAVPSRFIETRRYPAVIHNMYKLIRRISDTFFPRPDRPWNDDATSTAPQIGKKRRMSEDDDLPPPASIKKHRTGLAAEDTLILGREEVSSPTQEREGTVDGVKEVTKGVREVELEESAKEEASEVPVATEAAAAVPLPDSPVIEAQAEAVEAASPDAPAEDSKDETSQKPEDNPSEPAVLEAEKEKAVVELEADNAEAVATSDATSTPIEETTTIHDTADEVTPEEVTKEDVAETAA